MTQTEFLTYNQALLQNIADTLGVSVSDLQNLTYDQLLLIAINEGIENISGGGSGGGVTSINGTTGDINIKTINNTSLLGTGNIAISGGSLPTTTSLTVTKRTDINNQFSPFDLPPVNLNIIQPFSINVNNENYSAEGTFVNILDFIFNQNNPVYLDTINTGDIVGLSGGNFVARNIIAPNLKICNQSINLGHWVNDANITVDNIDFPVLKFCNNFSFNWINQNIITFPELEGVGGLNFNGNSNLPSKVFNFPKLKYTSGIFLSGFQGTLNLPELQNIFGFQFDMASNITTINLPKLEKILVSNTTPISGSQITSVNLPLLKQNKSQSFEINCPLASVINLQSLELLGGFLNLVSSALTTLNLPNIKNTSGFSFNTPNLTDLTLGTIGITKEIRSQIDIRNTKLNQTSIDGILALLVSLDGTNGTTLFGSGRSVSLQGGTASAPSATGILNRAILQSRGVTITTN